MPCLAGCLLRGSAAQPLCVRPHRRFNDGPGLCAGTIGVLNLYEGRLQSVDAI